MKKSQLRKIIKESIKELMLNEQTPVFHFWYPRYDFNGASCSSTNLNYPSVLYSNVVSGGIYVGGSFGNPLNATASGNVWNFLGSPSVGQNVKLRVEAYSPVGGVITFQGNEDRCFEYGGTSPTQTASLPNGTLPNVQFLGVYSDCASCNASIGFGCIDSQALNFDSSATQDDGSCDYGWRCGMLPSGGAVAEQVSMPTGCMPGTSTDPGVFSSEGFCLSQNTNIPNGCGGTSMGALVKPTDIEPKKADIKGADPEVTDPQIDRMQKIANIKKER